MQQKHVFRAKYFGKSVFGHFFCPFLTFPKYFQSKKLGILYNKTLWVLKAEGLPLELYICVYLLDNQQIKWVLIINNHIGV